MEGLDAEYAFHTPQHYFKRRYKGNLIFFAIFLIYSYLYYFTFIIYKLVNIYFSSFFSVSLGQMAIATDKMFRVLYPIVYLIFVCCYFLNYIHWMKTSSQFLLKYQTKCITSDSKKWRTCLFGFFNVRMRKKKMKEKVSREWKMIFGCYLVHSSIQHQNSSKNDSIFSLYDCNKIPCNKSTFHIYTSFIFEG